MKSSLTLFLINTLSLPWDSLTPGIGPHAGSLTSGLTLLLSLWGVRVAQRHLGDRGWPRVSVLPGPPHGPKVALPLRGQENDHSKYKHQGTKTKSQGAPSSPPASYEPVIPTLSPCNIRWNVPEGRISPLPRCSLSTQTCFLEASASPPACI